MSEIKCNCGEKAILRTVRKEGPNTGRQFYCCSSSRCKFFKWAPNHLVNQEKSISNQNQTKTQSTSTPNTSTKVAPAKCKCNIPAKLLQVNKEGPNKGRWFWTCSKREGKCTFFKWSTNTPDQILWGEKVNSPPKSDKGKKSPQKSEKLTTIAYSVHLSACYPPKVKEPHILAKIEFLGIDKNQNKSTQIEESIKKNIQSTIIEKDGNVYVPFEKYESLIKHLNSIKKQFGIKIEEIPKFVIDMLKSSKSVNVQDEKIVDWFKVPKRLKDALLPFQKQSISFAVGHEGRVLIADEMGLGKTIQAIAIASYYFVEWPLLVICPSALRDNWNRELEKWLQDEPDMCDIAVIKNGKSPVNSMVNIVSYDLASKDAMNEKLRKRNFQVVIIDESHYLKSGQSQRAKKISPIIMNAKRAIMLSGTATPSRPIEMFSQIKALIAPKLKKTEYGERYCEMRQTHFGVDYKGASNLSELNMLLERTCMIRRLKKDVLKELPPKKRQEIYFQVPESSLNEMKELQKKSGDNWYLKQLTRDSNMIRLYEMTGKAKIPQIQKYIKNEIEKGNKFLLFAHHQSVLDALQETLEKLKVDFIRIDGNTPAKTRVELATHFRGNDNCKVALLSITVAGTGLSFTPCSCVIFAELYWTPGVLAQAEDRVHRIGQKSDYVDIRYLLGKKTIDERIWRQIKQKLDVVGETLDGKENTDWRSDVSIHFSPRQSNLKILFKKQEEKNKLRETVNISEASKDESNDESPPKPKKLFESSNPSKIQSPKEEQPNKEKKGIKRKLSKKESPPKKKQKGTLLAYFKPKS